MACINQARAGLFNMGILCLLLGALCSAVERDARVRGAWYTQDTNAFSRFVVATSTATELIVVVDQVKT